MNNRINLTDIKNANRIAVPKGENSQAYRNAFVETTGIDIPHQIQPRLSQEAQEEAFFGCARWTFPSW